MENLIKEKYTNDYQPSSTIKSIVGSSQLFGKDRTFIFTEVPIHDLDDYFNKDNNKQNVDFIGLVYDNEESAV